MVTKNNDWKKIKVKIPKGYFYDSTERDYQKGEITIRVFKPLTYKPISIKKAKEIIERQILEDGYFIDNSLPT